MKRYKIHTGEDSKGLLKVSFVAEPAIQSKLMYFTEEKKRFVFTDEEKRIIYAPALIPDLDIFRKNINGEPANVFFDKETILKLHLDGCRNGYDSKINLNHSETEDITGVYCFENWIVGEDNRAEKLGFEVPEGTLMKGYKVDNEELWQDIKAGKVTGLSIEAALMPIEEEPINKFNMNKKTIIEKIVALFADEKTEYATGFFGNSLESGSIITDADGNPLADKEFEFDGKKYKTDAEGKVSEVVAEEKEVELEDDSASKITALETEIADLKAQLAAKEEMKMTAETELSTLKLSNETQVTEIVKLTADLIEAKKVQNFQKQEDIPYEKMSNVQKAKFNRGKL
jgi:uncharacterized small protein (DUF1192 family)